MSGFLSNISFRAGGVGDQSTRASSSSASPLWQNYEVFLSFSGEDTRRGFIDHLYHRLVDRGIMVFRYNEELRVAEKIEQLLEAIESSKISIPIISPGYASNIKCLKELLQILECKKTLGQLVFPIFYHVKPSDVREQKGYFGKKFRLCKRKHDLDGKFVQKLENAFIEVAAMKGWESDKIAEGYEGELVKLVVRRIFNELGKYVLVVPDFLVGVEGHVKNIMKMISASPSNDAKIIAIHGMGGLGKTTLAKVLYNELSNSFDHRSFVPNIREVSKTKGIEALQKQIISDILVDKPLGEISHIDQGMTIMEKIFKERRLLLLLDDVENKDQLSKLAIENNWFEPESIVIITTRNKDIAMASAVNISYELNELNDDQSYELFCKHAFGMDASCPRDLETMARRIVISTGGLPLAIEIIGSLLNQKDEVFWNETLERLRRKPDTEVRDKLKISYDSLEYTEQQIFLDIACLEIEDEVKMASYMWKSCGFYPEEGIDRLMSLSLIKMEVKHHRIIMLNQLRDLGREIVHKDGRVNIGWCSRIWLFEEAIEVIESKQGTPIVQALILEAPNDDQAIHCTSQQFEGMKNLRYLRMKDVHLKGDFEDLFQNLKWLRWSTFGAKIDIMGINFIPKRLVILDLSGNTITEHWKGWNQIKYLKVLKLRSCQHVATTPDFSTMKELEVLILIGCWSLREIHPSICKLSKTLKVLDVRNCINLDKLPIDVGTMEELRELFLDGTSIREIPIFEGYMTKLETLSASNCKKLVSIPESLGSLVELQNLRLYGCELLTMIPESIGRLHLLVQLDLSWTGITQLSDSIGDLSNLESLYLSGTPIKCLPTSIKMLRNLQKLHLDDCEKLSSVQGIENLMSLTHLAVTACHLEFELPNLSRLRQLNYLEIKDEGLREIPGLHELMSLTDLIISGCKSLQYLPDFSQFIKLKVLDAEDCELLEEIRGLEYLTSSLNLNLRGCPALRKVQMKNFMECLHKKLESLGIEISGMGGDCMQVKDTVDKDTVDIFIPIILEKFVSNAVSLSMLEHVVEHQRELASAHILSIFFGFKPSDESLQSSLFKEALSKLHKAFEDKLVIQLNDSFYASEEIDKQANSVCQMVLQKLKWIQLSIGIRLVGIDHHVDRILDLLDLEVNDVQAVWIWGQDGVGKTTLARDVYRQLCSGFEASCFIEEIDERARHSKGGIQFLQAKMVSDLLNREMEVMEDITEGINLISERFCHMKVLIVLDDVTEHAHIRALAGYLHWFGPGSRIIITARQECFMKVTPPAPSYKISYDLPGEHENTLVQLFCVHAFRRTDPAEDFDSLSREFLKILDPCRGLRLSIEILASYLHGKSVAEWTSELQSLKEEYSQNYVDTAKIISMSYDSLNKMQKQMFLDISCFPHGIDSRIVSSFCHGSLQSPSVDVFEVLILLSLVKIDGNKRIWMHRLVRDFGRKIVDSINRQGVKKGTEDVEGSDSHTSSELTLPDIKFLKLYEQNIYSDFDRDRDFARLRDLIRPRCSSESHLCFENGVVLDFSWCKNWTGCRQIKGSKLRVLNLTGCACLLETPDLSLCQNLEMLILERCSRLVKIEPSIQHLQRLAILNLKYCTELNVLPNEVGHLKALKELHLDGTSIQEIPISIGNLKNLQILSASSCSSLDHLPQSTCDLLSITELKLDFANITELPYSIWKRMKLQHLSLRDCRCIKSLPPFDGDVEGSLKELDVSGTSIFELPLSIVKLKSLRVLKVDFSFIRKFPPGFGELKNLEEVHASWCRNLEDLPEDIEKLESLRVFKMGFSSISSIPESIQLLTGLQTLDCTSCNKLQSLPELPSSLTTLRVQLTELKTMPDLVNLNRLRELALVSSSLRILGLNLPQIRDLPTLPDSLRKLSLCCAKLKHMPRLPSKLVVLSLQGCRSLTKLPTMKPQQNLLEIEILRCSQIKKIEGLGGLEALRILKISDCRIKSLQELGKLTSLTKLTLQDCPLLGNLCVKSLQNLTELEILRCPEIENIEGLEGLRELTLTISGCGIKMEKTDKS